MRFELRVRGKVVQAEGSGFDEADRVVHRSPACPVEPSDRVAEELEGLSG